VAAPRSPLAWATPSYPDPQIESKGYDPKIHRVHFVAVTTPRIRPPPLRSTTHASSEEVNEAHQPALTESHNSRTASPWRSRTSPPAWSTRRTARKCPSTVRIARVPPRPSYPCPSYRRDPSSNCLTTRTKGLYPRRTWHTSKKKAVERRRSDGSSEITREMPLQGRRGNSPGGGGGKKQRTSGEPDRGDDRRYAGQGAHPLD